MHLSEVALPSAVNKRITENNIISKVFELLRAVPDALISMISLSSGSNSEILPLPIFKNKQT